MSSQIPNVKITIYSTRPSCVVRSPSSMHMTRAVVEYSNIRIFEYKNSIRILMVLFEYLKLFEYSSIRILEHLNRALLLIAI